jgi:hypothetical protein
MQAKSFPVRNEVANLRARVVFAGYSRSNSVTSDIDNPFIIGSSLSTVEAIVSFFFVGD